MWNTIILNPMINALLWIYSLVGNFGIAIIVFTILVRLITHPLTAQQIKSTRAMQKMQKSKKWQNLQKKYKNDKQKLQRGAQMTRAMTLSMPLLMGYLALTFSSGLAIYFVVSNVVAILQYGVLVRV